jgi:hypothetical protein
MKSFPYLIINKAKAVIPTITYRKENAICNPGIFNNVIADNMNVMVLLNIWAIIDGKIESDFIAINANSIPTKIGLIN